MAVVPEKTREHEVHDLLVQFWDLRDQEDALAEEARAAHARYLDAGNRLNEVKKKVEQLKKQITDWL